MKVNWRLVLAAVLVGLGLVGMALGETLPPVTTPWSRTLLKAAGTNEAWQALNIVPSGGLTPWDGTFTGVFQGDGSGTTNLPVAKLIQEYGAVGAADDTATFQKAAYSGKVVIIPAGDYTVQNITMTNNTAFIGRGAHLIFKTGATGNMIEILNCTNVALEGLYCTGGLANDANVSSTGGNRNAIHVNVIGGAGATLRNCSVQGFSGTGYIFDGLLSIETASAGPYMHNTGIGNLSAFQCGMGFDFLNSGSPARSSEYMSFFDLYANGCAVAYHCNAGNVLLLGVKAEHCEYGLVLSAGSNGGKGLVVGSQFTHCMQAIYAKDLQAYWKITGCEFVTSTGFVYSNACSIDVENSILGSHVINDVRDNTAYKAPNTFRFNSFGDANYPCTLYYTNAIMNVSGSYGQTASFAIYQSGSGQVLAYGNTMRGGGDDGQIMPQVVDFDTSAIQPIGNATLTTSPTGPPWSTAGLSRNTLSYHISTGGYGITPMPGNMRRVEHRAVFYWTGPTWNVGLNGNILQSTPDGGFAGIAGATGTGTATVSMTNGLNVFTWTNTVPTDAGAELRYATLQNWQGDGTNKLYLMHWRQRRYSNP